MQIGDRVRVVGIMIKERYTEDMRRTMLAYLGCEGIVCRHFALGDFVHSWEVDFGKCSEGCLGPFPFSEEELQVLDNNPP